MKSNPSQISKTTFNPWQAYDRIIGSHGTMGAFYPANSLQESIGEDGADISVTCYHTKVYAIDNPVVLRLADGQQTGQLKKITLVHKGTDASNVTVSCPTLTGNFFEILFSNVGDQLELIWNGYSWSVLTTLNFMDPFLQTPWVS